MVGGAPARPRRGRRRRPTCRMRHEVFPSRNTSPAMLSMAKSSLTRARCTSVGLRHDAIVGVFGNRAAGGQRGEPRCAPAESRPLDAHRDGAMPPPPASRANPLASMLDDGVEFLARSGRDTARPGGTSCEEVVFAILERRRRDDLLGEDVERPSGHPSRSSSPRRDRPHSAARSTSSSRVGEQPAFGDGRRTEWPERPTRCRNVAIDRGEPIWQTRSTCADVDPELQRGRGYDRFELAAL